MRQGTIGLLVSATLPVEYRGKKLRRRKTPHSTPYYVPLPAQLTCVVGSCLVGPESPVIRVLIKRLAGI